MNHIINRLSAASIALLLFLAVSMPNLCLAADILLNYANFTPSPTFPSVQMERWKTEMEKRTGGLDLRWPLSASWDSAMW